MGRKTHRYRLCLADLLVVVMLTIEVHELLQAGDIAAASVEIKRQERTLQVLHALP